MTTSRQTLMTSISCLEDLKLSPSQLGYFHGLAQNEAHEVIFRLFLRMSEDEGVTRSFMAKRLDKEPAQITRWLGASGNWTLDTFTNLAIAMGHRPTFGVERLRDMRDSNEHHPLAGRNTERPIPPEARALNSGPHSHAATQADADDFSSQLASSEAN